MCSNLQAKVNSLNNVKSALNRKPAELQFLYSLGTSPSASSSVAKFLPTLAPPRVLKNTAKPTRPSNDDASGNKKAGKSKAELLRKYREKIGRPHLSEEALLRDALYILQGISGKYVRFVESDEASAEPKLIFEEDPVSTELIWEHQNL